MWSSKGRIVFWSKRDSDVEQIYSLDPNDPGGAWTRLTSDGVRAVDPEWSPDGSRVAFVRGEATGSDIWLVNADGSGAHALTSGAVRDMDPAWSRDGRWLAYVRGDVTEPVIHAIRADGEDDRVVTPEGARSATPTGRDRRRYSRAAVAASARRPGTGPGTARSATTCAGRDPGSAR